MRPRWTTLSLISIKVLTLHYYMLDLNRGELFISLNLVYCPAMWVINKVTTEINQDKLGK